MFKSSSWRTWMAGVVPAAVAFALSATVPPSAASAAVAAPAVRAAGSGAAIPDSYIVTLKDGGAVRSGGVAASARVLAEGHHGKLGHVWEALHGFSVTMSASDAQKLAADPAVDHVDQEQRIMAARHTSAKRLPASGTHAQNSVIPAAAQNTPPSWGLDRIDQHALPLDQHYSYEDSAGQGVHVYVISGGIDPGQADLAGRVTLGPNFVNDQATSADCEGGGTEEAGVIAGTTAGVAKRAGLVSVRVFGCNGVAQGTSIQDGFNWVIGNAVRPAVIMFDLSDDCVFNDGSVGPCDPTVMQQDVAAQEAAFSAGIAVVAKAGDSAADNCSRSSGSAPDTIYVGASTMTDNRASFSDFGPCLTMWAPGDQIVTDAMGGGQVVDGSSALAAAHVAGAAALMMGAPEFAGASPSQIRTELVTNRSSVIPGLAVGGSPDLLLFTGPHGLFSDGDSASVTPGPDGRLNVFGVNSAGQLFQSIQTSAGSLSWSVWTQAATTGWKSIAAQPNADGHIALAGLTPASDVWARQQTTAPGWTSWTQLTGVAATHVDMAHNSSNRMEMFATNQQGQAFHRAQLSAGSTSWGGWTAFSVPSGGKLFSIAAEANTDNRIEFFGVDDAGQVWRSAQTSATDTNWSGFTKLPGFGMATVSAARNSNGALELVGIDTGGNVWHRSQTTAGAATWTAWAPVNGKSLRDITAQDNTNDHTVQLIGVDSLGAIWEAKQTAPNAGYSGWSRIDGQLRP